VAEWPVKIDPDSDGSQMSTFDVPDNGSAWLMGMSLLPAVGVPPKDPHDDDEENGGDEEDDNGKDEEPAVIREPDECW
jgi:hypothetical protein